jgi:plasmid stabilization system protein ParE
LSDFNDIAEYIAKDSTRYASDQVRIHYSKPEILIDNIELGRIIPGLDNEQVRELIVGSYRMAYRVASKRRIDILTVHHSARLLSNNPAFKK